MAERNREKHGVTFEEASTVFYDVMAVQFYDEDYSDGEIPNVRSKRKAENSAGLPLLQTRRTGDKDHICTVSDGERGGALWTVRT
ncbi:MAG: hypothetical protein R6U36_11745 [Candidatus Fermentibacteraceae bacterium]